MKRLGLALGGGGARALAHIPILEAFDELGVRPHRLAGTSMGAVIAGAYASGLTAREIRERVVHMWQSYKYPLLQVFGSRDNRRWLDIVQFNMGRGALMKGDSLRQFLADEHVAADFESLVIPLKVVAADYHAWSQVVLDRGDLPLALQASMAVPGVFLPVEIDGRLLIDGSAVNPVPYDLWNEETDIRIAVDVLGSRTSDDTRRPGIFESAFNTIQLMQRPITNAKEAHDPPEILIRPEIRRIRMFEFHRSAEIYRAVEGAKEEFKRQLASHLDAG